MRDTQKTRAIAYLRVSGTGQIDGDGFRRQAEAILSYADRNNINLVDEYRDGGVSGTKDTDDRPGLFQVLSHCRGGKVGLVLVETASRLARDYIIQERIIQLFRDHGVQVIECDGGYDLTASDTDDPTRRLIRQVLAAVSEFDKSQTVLRLRAARKQHKKKFGRCEGIKPFGHDPKRPQERTAVKYIGQLYERKMGLSEMTRVMNGSNHKTRSGKAWTMNALHRILNREFGRERDRSSSIAKHGYKGKRNKPVVELEAVNGTNADNG